MWLVKQYTKNLKLKDFLGAGLALKWGTALTLFNRIPGAPGLKKLTDTGPPVKEPNRTDLGPLHRC